VQRRQRPVESFNGWMLDEPLNKSLFLDLN
jgi:hypothetical protein